MKQYYLLISFLILLIGTSCSDYKDQDYTILLPDAGEDQVIYTADTGTTIQLDGTASADINDLGFDHEWALIEAPDGISVELTNAGSLSPTFDVTDETTGRFIWKLVLTRGAQTSQALVKIDVNPATSQLIFVNAIEGPETASLQISSIDYVLNSIGFGETSPSYNTIILAEAQNADGKVEIEVLYGGQTLSLSTDMESLKSYTVYLTGTVDDAELLITEKVFNQSNLLAGNAGLDAINLSPGLENVEFFIDASSVGFGVVSIDQLFAALGVQGGFGSLNFKENSELSVVDGYLLPLPVWAQVNGERVSNDAFMNFSNLAIIKFGTFMLVSDSSAEFGNTFQFIANSDLLP